MKYKCIFFKHKSNKKGEIKVKTAKNLLYYNLVKVLDKNKISYSYLSEIIDISPSSMSMKMSGYYDFKLHEILKIQEFLSEATGEDYSLDYLFAKE